MKIMGHNLVLGSLAQPVEHRTFNPLVARSNRARPTNKYQGVARFRSPFFLPNEILYETFVSYHSSSHAQRNPNGRYWKLLRPATLGWSASSAPPPLLFSLRLER